MEEGTLSLKFSNFYSGHNTNSRTREKEGNEDAGALLNVHYIVNKGICLLTYNTGTMGIDGMILRKSPLFLRQFKAYIAYSHLLSFTELDSHFKTRDKRSQ
jgi:hypothetical protein